MPAVAPTPRVPAVHGRGDIESWRRAIPDDAAALLNGLHAALHGLGPRTSLIFEGCHHLVGGWKARSADLHHLATDYILDLKRLSRGLDPCLVGSRLGLERALAAVRPAWRAVRRALECTRIADGCLLRLSRHQDILLASLEITAVDGAPRGGPRIHLPHGAPGATWHFPENPGIGALAVAAANQLAPASRLILTGGDRSAHEQLDAAAFVRAFVGDEAARIDAEIAAFETRRSLRLPGRFARPPAALVVERTATGALVASGVGGILALACAP